MEERKNRGYWRPENVNAHLYEKLNELKRVPIKGEIKSGVLGAIISGKYNPKIKTWNQFLEYHGLEVNHDLMKWTQERINNAFYDRINKLRGVPKAKEFDGSAQQAISRRVIIGVKTYSQFVRYHGLEINNKRVEWSREKINEHFYDTLNKLGHIPTTKEIGPGFLNVLRRGMIHEMKNYNQFLDYHGLESNQGIRKNYAFDDWVKELKDHPEYNIHIGDRTKGKDASKFYACLYNWTKRETKDSYERKVVTQMILGRTLRGVSKKPSLLAEVLGA